MWGKSRACPGYLFMFDEAVGCCLLVAIRSGRANKKSPEDRIMKTQKSRVPRWESRILPHPRLPLLGPFASQPVTISLHLFRFCFRFVLMIAWAKGAWPGHVMRHAIRFLFKSISCCTSSDGFRKWPTAMRGPHLLLLFYFTSWASFLFALFSMFLVAGLTSR